MRNSATALLGAIALMLCFAASSVYAQSKRTEHTYKLDEDGAQPAATLDDVSWLAGSWTGDAFGQAFEQVWNAPSAGSMVGLFKLYQGDKVSFYELLLLVEEEGSLSLKVKHFTPEFIAWEDKEDYISFPLVRIDDDAIHFSGLSFYRVDEDRMAGYIVMRNEDELREEKLSYRRNSTGSRATDR